MTKSGSSVRVGPTAPEPRPTLPRPTEQLAVTAATQQTHRPSQAQAFVETPQAEAAPETQAREWGRFPPGSATYSGMSTPSYCASVSSIGLPWGQVRPQSETQMWTEHLPCT